MHSLTFGSVGVAKREPSLSGQLIALADTDLELAREVQERYGWEDVSRQIGSRRSTIPG